MKGFFNQILSVDLTRETFETESADALHSQCKVTPPDETLPKAFHTPLEDNGAVITAEQVAMLMDEYCELRGWDQ